MFWILPKAGVTSPKNQCCTDATCDKCFNKSVEALHNETALLRSRTLRLNDLLYCLKQRTHQQHGHG